MIDRRKFFSMLGRTAGAGVTLSAVRAIAPEAQAIEVHPDRQYVFRLRNRSTEETCYLLQEALKQKGLNVIVIAGDVEIFEVNGPAVHGIIP